jgi:mRNA-degrading endonuclease RelE of RelBE toxin-antitoxin system
MVEYDVVVHHDAKKVINNLPPNDKHRVTQAIKDVAGTRQPTNHSKCQIMQNDRGEKVYKIRVGDYRAIAQLDKPELQVLKVSTRQGAYRDVDDLYASL